MTNFLWAACFSAVYGHLQDYASMQIFIDQRELNPPQPVMNTTWDHFTKDHVEEYVRLLKVIGLNFKMSYNEDSKRYTFDVPLSENTIMHNKMILNCVRYLGESNYPGIVKTFLRFSKEKVFGVNLYTKLVIAHEYTHRGNVNHMFVPWYSCALQMSNEEVQRLIINNNKNQNLNFVIKQGKAHFADYNKVLSTVIQSNAPFNQVYKKYKELCAKYM